MGFTIDELGFLIDRALEEAKGQSKSREMALVITKLDEAQMWLDKVTSDKDN
jgi:hypothetical protein